MPNCPARRATRILRYADSQRTAHACAPGLLVNHLGQQLDKWRGSRRNSSRGRLEASYNFSGANFVVYDEGLKHEAINAAEPAACGARVLNKSMTRRIPMTMRILVPSLDLLLHGTMCPRRNLEIRRTANFGAEAFQYSTVRARYKLLLLYYASHTNEIERVGLRQFAHTHTTNGHFWTLARKITSIGT